MQAELHEARRLRKLLQTRLKPVEREGIKRQLKALERRASGLHTGADPKTTATTGPGYLGVFDRPNPAEVATRAELEKRLHVSEQKAAEPGKQSVDTTQATEPAQPVASAPEPELSAAEVEELAKKIADIADRIQWLRAYWATTLAPEVDREQEAWRARLIELAARLKTIAPDVLEKVMAGRSHLLTQPLRVATKATIPQRIQEDLLPPSAPSARNAEIMSEVYFYSISPRPRRQPERPPGYLPDGLQSWI